MKKIPYGHQWIDKSDINAVARVLRSDWITQGPAVEDFEKKTAKYCGAKYAAAVSSGTAALHAAYAAAGIKAGDEVITTPLTFAATASAAVYCGAKPVFADVKEDTLTIDCKEIEKKITKKTKAIVPVDFAGHPCDYDEIKKIAKKYNLLIIEDAAHSLGSEYRGIKIGSLADMTVLSFHPVKIITTGEGGMILTDRRDFYEKMKTFRQHGIVKMPQKGGWYYEVENLGYNYRLTDIQCALGSSQLKKLDRFIKRRRQIASRYNETFKDIKEIAIPLEKDWATSAWHLYALRLNLERLNAGRGKIFDEFQKQGIGVQVHYIPLNLQPFYQKTFGYKPGDFPVAENYYERAITLPLYPKMSDREVGQVIASTRKIINSYKK